MSDLTKEDLESFISPVAAKPDGFGVNHVVAKGVDLGSGQNTVELKVNEQSLASAKAQNNGGTNKHISQALAVDEKNQKQTGDREAALFVRHGLDKAVLASRASGSRYGILRSSSASDGPQPPQARHARLLRNTRTTGDRILAFRKAQLFLQRKKELDGIQKKNLVLNPESLPQAVMKKVVKTAVENGVKMTPLGPVVEAAKKVGLAPKMGQKMMPAPKKRQWAMINPELIPSGWATD